MNFAVLWLFTKVFSTKFGGMASFGTAKASNPRKFSLWKLYFSPIRESFLPWKFPAIQYLVQWEIKVLIFLQFCICWSPLYLFVKVFSVKFGGMMSFGMAQASKLRKFSPQKSYFFTNLRNYSPSKVSHCTITSQCSTSYYPSSSW